MIHCRKEGFAIVLSDLLEVVGQSGQRTCQADIVQGLDYELYYDLRA